LIKATNPLRELDVFLLTINPKSTKKVFKQLHTLRNEKYKTLLNEDFKIQLIQSIESFYDLITDVNPSMDDKELIKIAHQYYDKSVKEYNELPLSSSSKQLHALRIRFKISRYALEFLQFTNLEHTQDNIEESKKIQDILGTLHDLHNQVKFLKKLQNEHPSKELKKVLLDRKKLLKNSKLPINRNNSVSH
jgi:CHAD domain-containing protein